MASSLQHISEKMMKMDLDKVGVQSLGLDLIPWVPDKFLIKYDPPKIWVVYHFKDHNAEDQYWRDIPLEVSTDSTAESVTHGLFEEHAYYFDKELIETKQVSRLIQMIINKNSESKRKQNMGSDSHQTDQVAALAPDTVKSKARNKIFQDIDKAGEFSTGKDLDFPAVGGKKGKLEPIGAKPITEVKPVTSAAAKSDDFDLFGFSDTPANPQVTTATVPKNAEKGDDDFDFEFEDVDAKESSKMPPGGNKIETGADDLDDLFDTGNSKPEEKKKPEEKPKTIKTEPKKEDKTKSDDKKDNANGAKDDEEYIVIDGKRFREIQIEGEEEEFLMDDDGNIYDKEGVYIGTAKDGAEEEEEEAEK